MNAKDEFIMELTWYNCKTNPPKYFENNNLIVTNGSDVFGLSWHKAEGYFVLDDYGNLHELEYEHLNKWYWSDIEQTVRNFRRCENNKQIEFLEVKNMESLESTYEEIIWYLLGLLEDEHMGMSAEAIKLIKEEFDIEL